MLESISGKCTGFVFEMLEGIFGNPSLVKTNKNQIKIRRQKQLTKEEKKKLKEVQARFEENLAKAQTIEKQIVELQNQLRQIRLLDRRYLNQFVEEFENLMGEEII